jgi:hypothetical protein
MGKEKEEEEVRRRRRRVEVANSVSFDNSQENPSPVCLSLSVRDLRSLSSHGHLVK